MERLAFSLFEAAEAANLSRAQIHRFIIEGRGPRFRKAGRRTIILRSDLEEWLRTLPVIDSGGDCCD
jgi:hypothetical protein